MELAKTRVVELLYIDDESLNHFVVAYRFTSDHAFNEHHSELLQAGGSSLGRGTWNPWHDKYQYWEVFGCPSCGTRTEHGFNDIKDHTCPVQQKQINRHLVGTK
jgi:hypothetical protein